jgi:hypothetical protein
MAAHMQRCAGCSEEAQAETELRELWLGASAAKSDLTFWPQIARRMGGTFAMSKRPFPAPSSLRWTVVGAVGLTGLAVCGLWLGPKGSSETASTLPPVQQAAQPLSPKAPSDQYASWRVLSAVSRMDPAVDDPAGASTDSVWVLIDARRTEAR